MKELGFYQLRVKIMKKEEMKGVENIIFLKSWFVSI